MTTFSFPILYSNTFLSIFSFLAWLPVLIFIVVFCVLAVHDFAIFFAYPNGGASNLQWGFTDTLGNIFISEWFIGFTLTLLVYVVPLNLFFHADTKSNREQESNTYKLAQTYSESLQIELNQDPSNENLQKYAADFNSGIAKMVARSQNPRYAQNFTGIYDWNLIPRIETGDINVS